MTLMALAWLLAARAGAVNVGYRVLDLPCPGKDKTIAVAVWYPTDAAPSRHVYGGPTEGQVSVGAVPAAGTYPLLVFSHGYGGSGLGSVFLFEPLAARGWIVAAPDHHDADSAVRIRGGARDFSRLGFARRARAIAGSSAKDRDRYLYRLDEFAAALDGVLADPVIGPAVDRGRVAVGGHSFGGFTALGLCGTIPERRNPLIKGLLLFSTGSGGYLYRESELRSVKMPTLAFLGEKERDDKRGRATMAEVAARLFKNLPGPKYLAEVRGAGHFSFNNRFSDNWLARRLSGGEEQFAVIRRLSIDFLEQHVAGRVAGASAPTQDDGLTRYLHEP